MFKTTRGLVLREVHYKEADRILTILTEDDGKLTAKARGALRSKSKVSAATQLLAFSDLTLYSHNGMWTVSEAVSVEQFLGLRTDITRLALGSYIAEVLEAVCDEDAPDAAILHLGLNSLYALSSGMYPQAQVKAAFELRLMCLSGYEPELSACRACGREDALFGSFLPANGEFYCENCKKPGAIKIDAGVLAAMRHIISAEPKRVFSFSLDDEGLANLAAVCEAYALYELDRPFGSLDYYRKLRKFT
ncbi:MAG: DNA repair protein RecO [Oscillospiraceae bacterium]